MVSLVNEGRQKYPLRSASMENVLPAVNRSERAMFSLLIEGGVVSRVNLNEEGYLQAIRVSDVLSHDRWEGWCIA